MMMKKVFTIILCISLMICAFPATVFASSEELEERASSQLTGTGPWPAGDNVQLYINYNSGDVYFYTTEGYQGTLDKDWLSGSRESVKTIEIGESSSTIYFPKDSSYMFAQMNNLVSVNFRKFNTSRAVDMSSLFLHCEKVQELDLTWFDTSNVTSMSNMFSWCSKLKDVDLSTFNTSKLKYADYMFYGTAFNFLDLSTFNMSNVTSADYMLWHVDDLLTLNTPRNCKINVNLPVKMYDVEGNEYTSLPNKSYSMYLASSKILARGGFYDVQDRSSWYYVPVYWAAAKDVTSGMGDNIFQPDAALSRAQTVMFLYKLAGMPDVSGLPNPGFKDVTSDKWYYNAVKWAVANGITSGYGAGTFRPDVTCTRAMIVTFLMSYSKLVNTYAAPSKSSGFSDVPSNAWYKDAVDWAVASGVTSGYGPGTFQPNKTCNRAMMVTFLKKVAELPEIVNS